MKQTKPNKKAKLQKLTESVKSQLFRKTVEKIIQDRIELFEELANR